jgi:hypothetical protein
LKLSLKTEVTALFGRKAFVWKNRYACLPFVSFLFYNQELCLAFMSTLRSCNGRPKQGGKYPPWSRRFWLVYQRWCCCDHSLYWRSWYPTHGDQRCC